MRVRAGIILAVLLFCGSIRAIEPFLISVETPLVKNRAHWTPLQIMLCPHVSYCFLFGRNKAVCGLNLGFWTFQGTVSGVTLSLLSNDWYVRGLALSLASWSRNKTGVSVSLVQMSENNRGVMIGLCNLPSPVTGRNNRGIQLGIVNIWNTDYCPPLKAERPEHSIPERGYSFMQAGVVNIANNGWQIGLFNYNANSIFPYTILLNYSPEPGL